MGGPAQIAGLARRAARRLRARGGVSGMTRRVLAIYRQYGLRGLGVRVTRLSRAAVGLGPSRIDYGIWLRRNDRMNDDVRRAVHAHIATFRAPHTFSIVMPVYNPNLAWLDETVQSVQRQLYSHWQLCIVDDASTEPGVRQALMRYAHADNRIKVLFRPQCGRVCMASNFALAHATGDWIVLLDGGDRLAEHALYCAASAIDADPSVELIYSDEDRIDGAGRRFAPYFKCDWNFDLFYSHDMFSRLGVYRKSLVEKVGGFRTGLEGAHGHDLVLRCLEHIDNAATAIHHVPRVLYHKRVDPAQAESGLALDPSVASAGVRALNEHFARRAIKAHSRWVGTGYRTHYELPSILPMVTLIVPTRNGLELIRQCVESVRARTTYQNYEILIVDNGSDDPATLNYFATLVDDAAVRVLRDDRPFNYSALNNAAVAVSRGSIIGLVNNDIEVISPDWLSEMVSLAVQPEIGAVGAKLLYPDGTIQHAGVVTGIGGVAGHIFKHAARTASGYFGRAQLISSYSAVTAACLVIRKETYQQVGGMNERDLAVAFNDIDFCLRVREAGYRNVWTPYAELYHHESATRGYEDSPEKQRRFASEIDYMHGRWGRRLKEDPAYSPNLTLEWEDASLAAVARVPALGCARSGA